MSGAGLSIFTAKTGEYTHFSVSGQTLTLLVYALCIGIALAAVYAFYQKNVPGAVVRRVISAGALSRESAKTAAELGLGDRPLLSRELDRNVTLKRMIHRVEEEGEDPRYFLPEEEKYRAEVRYAREGNGIAGLILTISLAMGLALLLLWLLPLFLSLVDRMLGT